MTESTRFLARAKSITAEIASDRVFVSHQNRSKRSWSGVFLTRLGGLDLTPFPLNSLLFVLGKVLECAGIDSVCPFSSASWMESPLANLEVVHN